MAPEGHSLWPCEGAPVALVIYGQTSAGTIRENRALSSQGLWGHPLQLFAQIDCLTKTRNIPGLSSETDTRDGVGVIKKMRTKQLLGAEPPFLQKESEDG